MRIGIFLDEWNQGGVPVFLARLESQLTSMGHHVILFLLRPHGKREAVSQGLYRKLKARLKERCISLDMDSFPKHWRKAHFVETLLASQVECLLINQFRSSILYLEAIAENVPLISIAHTDSDYYYHEFLLTERMTAAHIAVSDTIYRRCVAFAGPERNDRVHLIGYGVEHGDTFVPEPEGPLSVIYCARLDPLQKRCRDLVPIWEKYVAGGGRGTLTIIGTGSAAGYLTEAMQSHVQSGRVHFCHHLDAQDVPCRMSRGDILLNVSNFEGLPQTVLEGACLGLYPVLSDIESGHREIVAKLETGTLCRLGDTTAFAEELLRLESDLPALRRRRISIRERALKSYNLPNCAHLYAQVMEGVKVPSPRSVEVCRRRPTVAERASRAFLLAKYRRYYSEAV